MTTLLDDSLVGLLDPEPDFFAGAALGDVREIADGVFAVNAAFWGFPNVVYLLRSGRAWALVDAGVAETPSVALAPFLERNGGWESLELVIGTHGHLDHIGGNAWIRRRASRARFAIGAADVAWAEDADRHYRELYELGEPSAWRPDGATESVIRAGIGDGVHIDEPVSDGDVLEFGEGRAIEVVHLGAHTPGQSLYVDRDTDTAFSGDAVQGAGVLNRGSGERDFPMYRTVEDYRRSLDLIRTRRASLTATAHVGLRSSDALDGFLGAALQWTDRFEELVLGSLTREPLSVEQLIDAMRSRLAGYAFGLQVRVTTREHLLSLGRRGLADLDGDDAVERWSARRA